MNIQMGIKGQFRYVVKNSKGNIKLDTDYQDNIILNSALDWLAHDGQDGDIANSLFQYCVVGTGNSAPVVTQNKLDNILKGVAGVESNLSYSYDNSDVYKKSKTYKYTFQNLGNVNISEIGLATTYQDYGTKGHSLKTRALIKDPDGTQTVISLVNGDQLDIYYKLWQVQSALDAHHRINIVDGNGVATPYNVIVRLMDAALSNWRDSVGKNLSDKSNRAVRSYSGDIGDVRLQDLTGMLANITPYFEPYIAGTYKAVVYANFGVSDSVGLIRSFRLVTGNASWQFRYGTVVGDSPINKKNTEKLQMVFEINWGRYEGAL